MNWNEIEVSRIDGNELKCIQKLGGDGKLRKIEFNGFEKNCESQELDKWLAKHATVLVELISRVPTSWENYFLSYLPTLKIQRIRFDMNSG